MNVTEAAPGIYVVRAFEPGEVTAVVASLKEDATAWQPAPIDAQVDVDRSVRDAEVYFDSPQPAGIAERELMTLCRDRLFAATRSIAAATAPKTVIAEVQIVRYHAGGHYARHRDIPDRDGSPRTLSVVCYLNDDFTGGETVFDEAGYAVPVVPGTAVAFLPELLHHARPVTSGTKYVITAWYHRLPSNVAP